MDDSPDPKQETPFWGSHCGNKCKFCLLLFLAACFAGQTYLVYSDPPYDEPLSVIAQQGRRIWYAKNCQSCHQLYGFGGFLGPDLTNAAPGLTEERLTDVLTNGTKQMPAFGMSPEDIEAMTHFLIAMNYTGQGQARALFGDGQNPAQILADFETEVGTRLASSSPTPASIGFDLIRSRACNACHIPFRRYSNGAADMSRISNRLDDEQIMHILENGKGTAMPKPIPDLTVGERDAILAYLKWLNTNRQDLLESLGMGDAGKFKWSDVPWWEFQ